MGDMMTKKAVMILGAGVMQLPMIRKAKDMGLFVIASDRNADAEGFKEADFALTLDIKSAWAHAEWAAHKKTGLPCMVKAIDNAASRGSRRIDSIDELEDALRDAKNHSTTGTAHRR